MRLKFEIIDFRTILLNFLVNLLKFGFKKVSLLKNKGYYDSSKLFSEICSDDLRCFWQQMWDRMAHKMRKRLGKPIMHSDLILSKEIMKKERKKMFRRERKEKETRL